MYMIDLIAKKKKGESLTFEEFTYLAQGISNGSIPDYQLSAWAMAVYFQGMSTDEVIAYTKAIINSGETIDLTAVNGFIVDKHSTGGVGDKTTLVLAPLLAACGLKVAKISGRSLGITGGTIDKLEIIPNFKCDLPIPAFINNINTINMSIISQTANLVPADKKLYALRDVTGSVDSMPLIAASVMAKKIAVGANLILLDIKCGKGAFVSDLAQARKLANLMVTIGKAFDKKVAAVISDMDKPLGHAIGNALELQEALLSLQQQAPADVETLVTNLAALALLAAKEVPTLAAGIAKATAVLQTEQPLHIFYEFIKAQGGDLTYLRKIAAGNTCQYTLTIKAPTSGYCQYINNDILGELAVLLGAGRTVSTDIIDPMAGIYLRTLAGQKVTAGSVIMELYTNKPLSYHDDFMQLARKTFTLKKQPLPATPIILEIIM